MPVSSPARRRAGMGKLAGGSAGREGAGSSATRWSSELVMQVPLHEVLISAPEGDAPRPGVTGQDPEAEGPGHAQLFGARAGAGPHRPDLADDRRRVGRGDPVRDADGPDPFQGTTPLSTLAQVSSQEPVSPGKIRSSMPPDLETICAKRLEKEPGRRHATASERAEDPDRLLPSRPLLARPTPAWGRLAER